MDSITINSELEAADTVTATTHKTIGVVMTCYNRKELTLRCLANLANQDVLEGGKAEIKVFMTDDGSSDGTAEAVAEAYPEVTILKGDGSLFWNGGMNLAYGEALKHKLDYYLWLNDDTFLYDDAIRRLIDTHEEMTKRGKEDSIILGGTVDPNTKEFSYGGFKRLSKWTLKMVYVKPGDVPKECHSNTGNCVLIPKAVYEKVGNIEPFYTHRWGDPDYGLRTRKAGGSIWLAPGFIGECETNPTAERWSDPTLPFKERLKDFHSVKGYIRKDWFFFVRRHGGPLWPLLWAKPYVDMFITSFKYKFFGIKVYPDHYSRTT